MGTCWEFKPNVLGGGGEGILEMFYFGEDILGVQLNKIINIEWRRLKEPAGVNR